MPERARGSALSGPHTPDLPLTCPDACGRSGSGGSLKLIAYDSTKFLPLKYVQFEQVSERWKKSHLIWQLIIGLLLLECVNSGFLECGGRKWES